MTGYTAYVIGDASRAELLERFPPKYPDIIAHHITLKYGAAEGETPREPGHVRIVGHHDGGNIQVLVAEVDGEQHQQTETDGAKRFLHITLSLDKAQGVSARNSNDLLEKIASEQGEAALRNLREPFSIRVAPQFLVDEDKPAPKSAPGMKPE